MKLETVHKSMRALRYSRAPLGMTEIRVTNEQLEAMQKIAIDVFTRSSNNGHGFVDALAWVYLTGLEHGSSERPSEGGR